MIPQYLLGVFAWGVHYLLQGVGLGTLAQWFAQRFPGLTGQDFTTATDAAQQAIEVTGNLLLLDFTAPISDALAGAPQPAPAVNVRTLVEFVRPDGSTYVRTLDWEYDWTTTMGELIGDVAARAARVAGDYNVQVNWVQIVPPTLFPRI